MRAPKWATGVAVVVVLGAWATTLVVDMVNPAYDPPTGIEPLMMALAAFLFAAQPRDSKRDAKRRTEEELDDEPD